MTLKSGLGRPGMAALEHTPLPTRACPQTRTQESIHSKRQFKSAQINLEPQLGESESQRYDLSVAGTV